MNNKILYLIDGSAYIYRGFHALPMLTNSNGLPTNAVLGFTNILTKLLNEKKPEYIGICFDAKGPTFRHEMYGDYKANRPPMPDELSVQIPYIRKITDGYNLKTIDMKGFEADDIIGTIASKAVSEGFKVIMVTGDKDFMQLVTDDIKMHDPVKDITYGVSEVTEKTGVTPDKIIDIMALTGDKSDNVPGVPGIGKKTAPVLINKFGSLELLYENIESITAKKQKEKLIDNKKDAFLSKELVTINCSMDLDFNPSEYKFENPDSEALLEVFGELEFKKYSKLFEKEKPKAEKKYKGVFTEKELNELNEILKNTEIISVDTETTSSDPMLAELVGLSFSIKENEGYYIPCCHKYEGVPEQLELEKVLNVLKPVLENETIKKVGQNIKYDIIVLKRSGIDIKGIYFDTMAASYVLNPSKRTHGLDSISMDLFDHETIKFEDIVGKEKKSGFWEVPVEKAVDYASEDADLTLMAFNVFSKKLEEQGLDKLFFEIEMPLVSVLAEIELNGICVDLNKLEALSKDFKVELTALEGKIYELAGEEFNIKSSKQLGVILFEKLNLPKQKKTKKTKGYSTDSDVLKILASHHELPEYVLRYRTISKLKSTYSDALAGIINPATGRIHTSFNQTVTVTGRLSSSNPNLQNIPIKTEEGRKLRQAFIPEKGWKFISADYSQIELRILAHCADDPILIKAFIDGEDIHSRTAAEIFGHHISLVTSEMRSQAKAVNFGIAYGMSPYGLSKELNITQKMAKTFIENYFQRYGGVKNFIDETIKIAEKTCETSTLLGRIRPLPEIKSSRKPIKEFANRAAVNTPVQGTAADMIKIAMINVQKYLKENNIKARMLISVHDEIVLEAPEETAEEVMEKVVEIMESAMELKVPLKVNACIGNNWDEAH